jgi:dephospho-CoA kinase
MKPKLLIIGHGRHGKDTMAEILERDHDMTFKASSMAASEIFIYKVLKEKYGYETAEECFNDRSNHRAEWYDMICEYNIENKAQLAKDIMSTSDCYVGMRDRPEIVECKQQGIFDLIIWVDASERLPKEGTDSFNIDMSDADIVIYNNESLESFEAKVKAFGKLVFVEACVC